MNNFLFAAISLGFIKFCEYANSFLFFLGWSGGLLRMVSKTKIKLVNCGPFSDANVF